MSFIPKFTDPGTEATKPKANKLLNKLKKMNDKRISGMNRK